MGLTLDCSVLIAAERSKLRMAEFCASLGDEEVFLAAIIASELLHGAERAANPLIRTQRAAFVEALLSRFQVLEFDLDVARHHARLWAALAVDGLVIGPHVMQIAATALRHDFAVATLNLDEFRRVPGVLLVELRNYL